VLILGVVLMIASMGSREDAYYEQDEYDYALAEQGYGLEDGPDSWDEPVGWS
jgi:hypothetical protein